MVPWSEEAYPPFSTQGQQRYEAAVMRLGRMVAEEARAKARAGHANSVSDDHVDLAMEELLPSESERNRRGLSGPLVPSLVMIAGTAVLAALRDWRWANFGVAALLLVVVVMVVRDGRG